MDIYGLIVGVVEKSIKLVVCYVYFLVIIVNEVNKIECIFF